MTPEKRELLRDAVLTKVYRDEDYSALRFMFYHTIFTVLTCTFLFGSIFIGTAIFGNQSLETAISILFFFFILSFFAAFLKSFQSFRLKAIIPHKIQLFRSILVIVQKDGSEIRISYNHCRWSKRTCFAFYGYYGTGLSQNGLLFYLPPKNMDKLFRLLVPLSNEEKSQWIEKLQVSCEEVEPSYLRMFAFAMTPLCIFLPAFLLIGLVVFSILPMEVCGGIIISLIGGAVSGIFAIANTSVPPSARFLAVQPLHKMMERWGIATLTTLTGLAFPLTIIISSAKERGTANLSHEILGCFIIWGILMIMTGSLSSILYRPKKKNKKTDEMLYLNDR
jgi:hypothetical protein